MVIVTKYRRPVINAPILNRLKFLIVERIEAWQGSVLEINGEPDHIHILFECPPTYAIADLVNAIKTGTSRRIKKEFSDHIKKYLWKEAFWTRSYCLVTCGGDPLKVIKQYIKNQKFTPKDA